MSLWPDEDGFSSKYERQHLCKIAKGLINQCANLKAMGMRPGYTITQEIDYKGHHVLTYTLHDIMYVGGVKWGQRDEIALAKNILRRILDGDVQSG